MIDERKLNYLKHCYNEMISNEALSSVLKEKGVENSFDYLKKRIVNADTEMESEFFTAILKRIVDPNHIDDEEDLILYETEEDELFLRIFYGCGGQQFFIDTNFPEDSYSTFDAEDAFKHIITINGNKISVENYLSQIGYNYSYIVR